MPEKPRETSLDEWFEREGLLAGLEGAGREERLGLLEWLHEDGVAIEDLQRHTAEGTIMFVPAERVIAGRQRYTAEEIASQTGTDVEFLLAARRAVGLPVTAPQERVYFAPHTAFVRALIGYARLEEVWARKGRAQASNVSRATQRDLREFILRRCLRGGSS